MNNLEKLMMKKKNEDPMDEDQKKAKMSMLQALRQEMADMMKDDLTGHGMKKVEVAGNNPEAIKAGLDKAKDMISDDDEEKLHEGGFSDGSLPKDDDKDWEDEEKEEGAGPGYSDEAEGEHEDDAESEEMPEHENGAELIAHQMEHEGNEGELSDDEIEHLERLLGKMKKSKMRK